MKRIKAIIFDYDGTLLLKGQSQISKEIKLLLVNLNRKGYTVILATGRPLNHCRYLLEENLIDYIVSANGALVSTKYNNIYTLNITKKNVNTFKNFCIEKKIPASFYTNDILVNGIVNNVIEIGLRETMDIDVNSLKKIDETDEREIYLMCAFCDSNNDQMLKKRFSDMFLSRWHQNIISVLEYNVTKITGISKVLEHSQISPLECIAVGDGNNDIDMLQLAKYGIAIGDNQNLVEVADIIIESVNRNFIRVITDLCKGIK